MLEYFCLSTAVNLCGILMGSILSKHKRFALARLSKKLDRKPFNCKPCLTFHLLWAMYAMAGIALQSVVFFAVGVLCAGAIYGVLHIENQRKITK